jgi:hypothetical protein
MIYVKQKSNKILLQRKVKQGYDMKNKPKISVEQIENHGKF